jgi:hypothetical protein
MVIDSSWGHSSSSPAGCVLVRPDDRCVDHDMQHFGDAGDGEDGGDASHRQAARLMDAAAECQFHATPIMPRGSVDVAK